MRDESGRFESDLESGLFPTFFFSGFECSTFVWKDGERKDYVALTRHDCHLQADYARVLELGIGTVREAIRWPLVDRAEGSYDWSSVKPVVDVVNHCHITPIWDLCHYGFPDGTHPLQPDCVSRFTAYCRAVAGYLKERVRPPHFFTPVNEITFLSGASTDMEWIYPFAKGRRDEMRIALCRMAIEGTQAIRSVLPDARMVHVDPVIHEVPPPGRPDLAEKAWLDAYAEGYRAWDILAGRHHSELGGAPEILDIVGVNVYAYCESQLDADNKHEALSPRDPRRKPLSDMLLYAWERYRRPMIIGETSGSRDGRADWLRMVMQESLVALNSGIDLQGICLFPCIDMPDWNTGKLAEIGIYDLRDLEECERVPCDPYIEELRRWQDILNHPASTSSDSLCAHGVDTVQLSEVRDCARQWGQEHPDRRAHEPARQAA